MEITIFSHFGGGGTKALKETGLGCGWLGSMIKARIESSVGNRDSYVGQGKPNTCTKDTPGAQQGIKKITGLEDEQNQ